MTVKKLIKELSKVPGDSRVFLYTEVGEDYGENKEIVLKMVDVQDDMPYGKADAPEIIEGEKVLVLIG